VTAPSADLTGSVTAPRPAVAAKTVASAAPAARTTADTAERLPETIGGPKLREAALNGDAAAAYEVASRYADGKLVAQNYTEAAKWYDRAAQKGLVPAMFRLGSLYEKGLGVPKDVGAAKRSYIAAAEGGNPKAMHNLAVLFADGGGQGPDYKTASEWFRKASDYGLADSQYNLAVLYARGIGVEQNLVESYKWFSLAAAQGDTDAGRKRDDIAKRMDQPTLTAAQLAIRTYVPLGQVDTAVAVAPPQGGWDAAPAAQASNAQAPKAAPARAKR
jgi:localization factor PodJL